MPDITFERWGPADTSQASPSLWSPPAQPAGSPFAVPPAPQGVDVAKFRQESGAKAADEMSKMREQGLGAIDFLTQSSRAKQAVGAMPDSVFGPWQGSQVYNEYVRSPLAALPGDPLGERPDMQQFAEKQGLLTNLATAKFREKFGARPTQMEFGKVLESVGGFNAPDAQTAVKQLDNYERDSFDGLQNAVRAGVIKPSEVHPDIVKRGISGGLLDPKYFLPTLSPQDAARMPPGTMFLTTDGRPMVR